MFIALVVGTALMTSSPGVNHPIRVEIRDIASEAECRRAGAGLIEILRSNGSGQLHSLRASCRAQ